MIRFRAPVAVLAAAVALAGCGGGSKSESEKARDAVKQYIAAFTGGDGAKACELMTKQTREQFVARVSVLTGTGDCGTAVKRLSQKAGPQILEALKKAKVGNARIQGNAGTVPLTSGPNRTDTQVLKEGGDWKVTSVPGTK